MPTSHSQQLNEIVELIVLVNPRSILDVGVGFGKYGFLSREYLDLRDGREELGDWKRSIDGIEAFKGYLTPVHDYIYDHIYVGNAVEILPTLEKNYDLILLIDILEHLNRNEGIKILRESEKRGRNIIVSTPKSIASQKSSFRNPFEVHRSQWTYTDFDSFTNRFFIPNYNSIICYIGDDALKLKKALRRSRFGSRIGRLFPFFKIPDKFLGKIG